MAHISVVSPVYIAESILPELVERIIQSVKQITDDFEIILVEDGSSDQSWAVIERLANECQFVKGIKLSRNFGQHYAITAGLDHANADWVVVMDCDLQDQPEEIIKLYQEAKKGYDIVYARRQKRTDKFLKRVSSKVFHFIFRSLSGVKTNSSVANFGIYKKSVIDGYRKMKEVSRSFGSLVYYLGFKYSSIDVDHGRRKSKKSTYSVKKLIKLSVDIILSNSNRPLLITVFIGFVISILSLLMAAYNVYAYYRGLILIAGFTTTVFSIWFVGGLILFVLGMLGLYIGKIFDQVKNRPMYLIAKTVNI